MSEDKKWTNRSRFNLLDCAIILLVLLCAIGIWQYDNLERLFGNDAEPAYYELAFSAEPGQEPVDRLLAGIDLYIMHHEEKYSFGTMAEKATLTMKPDSGELGEITGIIRCRLTPDGDAYRLFEGINIATGGTYDLLTETGSLRITVTSITPTP